MLTYTQRQQVQQGGVKPELGLNNLIALIAVDFALEFREQVKQFDMVDNSVPENPVAINTNANQYKSQVLGLCNRVLSLSQNKELLASLVRCFVTLLGRSQYTYSQLESATQQQWENFIKTGNPASSTGYDGILKIFEHIAGTTKEGKAEYDNL